MIQQGKEWTEGSLAMSKEGVPLLFPYRFIQERDPGPTVGSIFIPWHLINVQHLFRDYL